MRRFESRRGHQCPWIRVTVGAEDHDSAKKKGGGEIAVPRPSFSTATLIKG